IRPRLGPVGKRKHVPIRVAGEESRYESKLEYESTPTKQPAGEQPSPPSTRSAKRKCGESPIGLASIPEDFPLDANSLQVRRLSIGTLRPGLACPPAESLDVMLETARRNPATRASLQLLNKIDDVVIVARPRLQRYKKIRSGDLDSVMVEMKEEHHESGCHAWIRRLMSCFEHGQRETPMRNLMPYRDDMHNHLLQLDDVEGH
ncbi:hypothetical protein BVRB_035380, partial [Beta vulgaris subsp. vulgaris]